MNIKKLFPESKESRKGLMEFLDKKGFYIVLILCIIIVGATAVFVTTHNTTSPIKNYDAQNIVPEETGQDIASDAGGNVSAQSSINSVQGNPEPKAAVNKAADAGKIAAKSDTKKQTVPKKDDMNVPAADKSTGANNTAAGKSQKFIMPVFGGVTFSFAQDKLVYSKTLEEWRTHSGVDLAADRGVTVKAVADGIVSDIKNDPRLGVVIIIDHQNGIKTVYANLASDDTVSPNQRVKQGDIIGSVGNTANFESVEESHLHFEVLKNNGPVDPMAYLPKK